MNILIFEWRDIKNPRAGGSEIYFHELAKRWIKSGNKVRVICGGWKGCRKKERIDGIDIIRVGNEISAYVLVPLEYLRLREKPDVIIDVENGLPFFSPLFSGRKKFLHIHHIHKDVWKREAEGKGIKEKMISMIGKFLETKVMPGVYRKTGIITLSKSSAEEIEKEHMRKVQGIVNPGIEFYKYKKARKSKTPSVLFLNRIKKYKGVKVLLDAANTLKGENISFLIAGSGDDLERMRGYAKKKKIDAVFLGKISEEKKMELMQKAWIFINPSFKEGWGIVNIEANYFGTPVIGSNVSGIRDSIIDGKTGLLFEYGKHKELAEQINELVRNGKKLNRMSKSARAWAKNFDYNSKAEEYLRILRG